MEPAKNRSGGHTRLVLVVAAFILGAGLGGLAVHFLRLTERESPPTRPVRQPKAERRVTALGRIEPAGGVVTLGIPIPDRVQEILPRVKEEAPVTEGQELVKLESYQARELELQLAKKQLHDALQKKEAITIKGDAQIELDKLRLKQLAAVGPFNLEMQEHKIQVLTQQSKNAQKNLERSLKLESTISHQEIEQQKLLAAQAEAELDSVKIELKKLKRSQELEQQGAEAQLRASKAALKSALKELPIATLESQVALAKVKLADAIVRAPSKGKILRILARRGELVGAQQPILQMADTEHMIVVAEVYETDVGRIRIGNSAKITGRALKLPNGDDKVLTGKVMQIGAIIGKNRVVDADPTVDVDRRVVDVKIRLDDSAPAASLINHQVKVEIDSEK
jgi:HlyD family secretion protein